MNRPKMSLQMWRKQLNITQEAAAKGIGISVDTLSNYERGKTYPDIPILRKIEKFYGIGYDDIIFLPIDYDLTVNYITDNKKPPLLYVEQERERKEPMEKKQETYKLSAWDVWTGKETVIEVPIKGYVEVNPGELKPLLDLVLNLNI